VQEEPHFTYPGAQFSSTHVRGGSGKWRLPKAVGKKEKLRKGKKMCLKLHERLPVAWRRKEGQKLRSCTWSRREGQGNTIEGRFWLNEAEGKNKPGLTWQKKGNIQPKTQRGEKRAVREEGTPTATTEGGRAAQSALPLRPAGDEWVWGETKVGYTKRQKGGQGGSENCGSEPTKTRTEGRRSLVFFERRTAEI